MVLTASGIPVITCTNPGNNDVPGQSSPKVTASGHQSLPGNDPARKNGKYIFTTETGEEQISWSEAGCPNAGWTAQVDFVFWTNATLSLYRGLDANNLGELVGSQDYVCTTTRFPASVICERVD
jgi:hypothetical protein